MKLMEKNEMITSAITLLFHSKYRLGCFFYDEQNDKTAPYHALWLVWKCYVGPIDAILDTHGKRKRFKWLFHESWMTGASVTAQVFFS